MNTVRLRNVEIGTGKPKVIVPIVEKNTEEILTKGQQLRDVELDVVEWRADLFEQVDDTGVVLGVLEELRRILEDTPILFTFRTKREGGARELSMADYTALNCAAAQSGFVDAVDVEVFSGEAVTRENIANIHAAGVAVVGSSHEFEYTPSRAEMVSRLCKQQELGCDILKLAVMPKSKGDVLELLAATLEMHEKYARQPLVTMSMGEMGVVSRLCGGGFGSAMTFGAVGQVSAPGQIPAERLNVALKILHQSGKGNKTDILR